MFRCCTPASLRRFAPSAMVALLAGAVLLMPTVASGEVVVGSIRTRVRQGASAAIPVVYAERLDTAAPSRAGSYTIVQRGKAFLPRVLAVPLGSSVAFPNEDPIFHNVFSLSMPQPFDLGLYRSGAAKTRSDPPCVGNSSTSNTDRP